MTPSHLAEIESMSTTNGSRKPNTFSIDEREVDIRAGETIFRAARRLGIKLPHLCYSPKPGYRPDGNCRVCMVEIEGERVLAA
jgi:formate dehydrogenase major subunit